MRSGVQVQALIAFACLSSTLFFQAGAFEVAPNSPCSSFCNLQGANFSDQTASLTNVEDVICRDSDIGGPNSTEAGRKWRSCLTCLSTSPYVDPTTKEVDLFWFLFNIKFSFAWCTLGFTTFVNPVLDDSQAQCIGSCESLQNSVTNDIISQNMAKQYNYCDANDAEFTKDYRKCRDCLRGVPSAQSLSQYLEAMNVACTEKPATGEALHLSFDIIATTKISTSTIPASILVATPTATATPQSSVPALDSESASTSKPQSSGPTLSRGAAAGIAIGVATACIFSGVAVLWFCMKRRNQAIKSRHMKMSQGFSGFHGRKASASPPEYRSETPDLMVHHKADDLVVGTVNEILHLNIPTHGAIEMTSPISGRAEMAEDDRDECERARAIERARQDEIERMEALEKVEMYRKSLPPRPLTLKRGKPPSGLYELP